MFVYCLLGFALRVAWRGWVLLYGFGQWIVCFADFVVVGLFGAVIEMV